MNKIHDEYINDLNNQLNDLIKNCKNEFEKDCLLKAYDITLNPYKKHKKHKRRY